MSLIFLEVTKEKTINLNISVYQEQEKSEISEISLDMPEGSTLDFVLKKLGIPNNPNKLLIQVNGEKIHDENHILKNNNKLIIKVLLDDHI
jgi:sulfur carrier protein ThiS